jgi:hypothetical protein
VKRKARIRYRTWAFMCLACVVVGACERSAAPVIPVFPGAGRIKVVHSEGELHSSCRLLGRLSDSDGEAFGPSRYDGSDDRAVSKIRNSAARIGANLLLVLEKGNPRYPDIPLDEITADCGKCKHVVWMTVDAYSCP